MEPGPASVQTRSQNKNKIAKRNLESIVTTRKKTSNEIIQQLRFTGSWFATLSRINHNEPKNYGVFRIDSGSIPSLSADIYGQSHGGKKFFPSGYWYPSFDNHAYKGFIQGMNIGFQGEPDTITANLNHFTWNGRNFTEDAPGMLVLSYFEINHIPILTGKLQIGSREWEIRLEHTSPYFRGVLLEIQTFEGCTWVNYAISSEHQLITLQSIFQTMGIDVDILHSTRPPLTNFEEVRFLGNPDFGPIWQILVIIDKVGPQRDDDLYGMMFDRCAPEREGIVIYSKFELSKSSKIGPAHRENPLCKVPLAFLRTLAHEMGHALNLDHIVRNSSNREPTSGTTLMNTTEEVIQSGESEEFFPYKAKFHFEQDEWGQLLGAPDPQVKPGWMPYNWVWNEPNFGFVALTTESPQQESAPISLSIEWPRPDYEPEAGGFTWINVVLKNTTEEPVTIPSLIRLTSSSLHFSISQGERSLGFGGCSVIPFHEKRTQTLSPSAELIVPIQLTYLKNNKELRHPGKYQIHAILSGGANPPIISDKLELNLKPAKSPRTLNRLHSKKVRSSFNFGFLSAQKGVRKALTKIAGESLGDTSLASELILLNSVFEDGAKQVLPAHAKERIGQLIKTEGWDKIFHLTTAIIAPLNFNSPLLDHLMKTGLPSLTGEAKPKDTELVRLIRDIRYSPD